MRFWLFLNSVRWKKNVDVILLLLHALSESWELSIHLFVKGGRRGEGGANM